MAAGLTPGVTPGPKKDVDISTLNINTDALVEVAKAINADLLSDSRLASEEKAFTSIVNIDRKLEKLVSFFGADKDSKFDKAFSASAKGPGPRIKSVGLQDIRDAIVAQTRMLTRILAAPKIKTDSGASSGVPKGFLNKLTPVKKPKNTSRNAVLKHSPESVYIADTITGKLSRLKLGAPKKGIWSWLLSGIGVIVGGIVGVLKKLWGWFRGLRWVSRFFGFAKGWIGRLLAPLAKGVKSLFDSSIGKLFAKHNAKKERYEKLKNEIEHKRLKRQEQIAETQKRRNQVDLESREATRDLIKDAKKKSRAKSREIRRTKLERDASGKPLETPEQLRARKKKALLENKQQLGDQKKLARQMGKEDRDRAQRKLKRQRIGDRSQRRKERQALRKIRPANIAARAASGLAGAISLVADGVSAYNDAKAQGHSSGRALGEAIAGGGLMGNVSKYAALGGAFGPYGAAAGAAVGVILTAIGPEAIGKFCDKLQGVYGFTLEQTMTKMYDLIHDDDAAAKAGMTKEEAFDKLVTAAQERYDTIGTDQGFAGISSDNFANMGLQTRNAHNKALFTLGDTAQLLKQYKTNPKVLQAMAEGKGMSIETLLNDLKTKYENANATIDAESKKSFINARSSFQWESMTEEMKQDYYNSRRELALAAAEQKRQKFDLDNLIEKKEAALAQSKSKGDKASIAEANKLAQEVKAKDLEYRKAQIRTAAADSRALAVQQVVKTDSMSDEEYKEAVRKKTEELMSNWLESNDTMDKEALRKMYGADFATIQSMLKGYAQDQRNRLENKEKSEEEEAVNETIKGIEDLNKTMQNGIGIENKGKNPLKTTDPELIAQMEKATGFEKTKLAQQLVQNWATTGTKSRAHEQITVALTTGVLKYEDLLDPSKKSHVQSVLENMDRRIKWRDPNATDDSDSESTRRQGNRSRSNSGTTTAMAEDAIFLPSGLRSSRSVPRFLRSIMRTGRAFLESTSRGLRATTAHPQDIIAFAMQGTPKGALLEELMRNGPMTFDLPQVATPGGGHKQESGIPFPLQIISRPASETPTWVSKVIDQLDKLAKVMTENKGQISTVTNYYPRISEKELMVSSPYLV